MKTLKSFLGSRLRNGLFGIILSASAVPHADAAEPKPFTKLYQAEEPKANGDVIVREEDGALGGKYVTHPREWNPLFIAESPTQAGEYSIWIRARGYAMILKAFKEGGEQQELKQIFNVPSDAWGWINIGKYSNEQLLTKFLLIRAAGGSDDAGLDAVVVTNDPSFDPATVKDFSKLGK